MAKLQVEMLFFMDRYLQKFQGNWPTRNQGVKNK